MGYHRCPFLLVGLFAFVASGCGNPAAECETDGDCPTGQACLSNGGVLFADRVCAPLERVSLDAGDTTSDTGSPDTRPTDTRPTDTSTPDTTPTDTATSDLDTSPDAETCVPEAEQCNGRDDDCDETIDEGCDCSPDGKTVDCYPAADPGTEGVGICTAGQKTCRDGSWGDCEGAQTPLDEVCSDGEDNDCDGESDEDCACNYEGDPHGVCAGQMKDQNGDCIRPDAYQPEETNCSDGLDNECDDDIDEATDACQHRRVRLLGSPKEEEGDGIAVGPNDAIYITGDSRGSIDGETARANRDIVLAKYSPSGNLEWLRRPATDAMDLPTGVDVGPSGAVYLTGQSRGALTESANQGSTDGFLAKYSASGDQDWIVPFATSGKETMARPIVGNNGFIYASGSTTGTLGQGTTNQGGADVFIARYDASGSRIWLEMFGTSGDERASDMGVDNSAHVYLTGSSDGDLGGETNSGKDDAFIARYDASGVQQRLRLFGTSTDDHPAAIAVTPGGRAYVYGSTNGDLGGRMNHGGKDTFLASFAPNGTRDWVRLIGTAEDEQGRGVAVDDKGGAVIGGFSWGHLGPDANQGASDIFLGRFDPSGNRGWIRMFGGTGADDTDAIATGGGHPIYFVGDSVNDFGNQTNAGSEDLLVVRAR